ncbi:MAG: hypothetical protein QNJ33_13290 [Crocosphaera sp.]|nr:hypothetical protein [Crocosphaera sp.]
MLEKQEGSGNFGLWVLAILVLIILLLGLFFTFQSNQSKGANAKIDPVQARQLLTELADNTEFPNLLSGQTESTTDIEFEQNAGQLPDYISFRSQNRHMLLADGSYVTLLGLSAGVDPNRVRAQFLRTAFSGANSHLKNEGINLTGRLSNFFVGKRQVTNVASFEQVRYENLYQNIDIVYGESNGNLKYSLTVHPGGDPTAIRLAFNGVKKLRIDEAGNLVIETAAGKVTQAAPSIYQQLDNKRVTVKGHYQIYDQEVGIVIDEFDQDSDLIIDPEIIYSTFFGGSEFSIDACPSFTERDIATTIAVNGEDEPYIGGYTCSLDFPTENPFQADLASVDFETFTDGFITKFAADGMSVIFSTFFGGSDLDEIRAITLTPDGSVVATGITASPDWPLADPLPNQDQLSMGITPESDAFVVRLNSLGDTLEFSTYLGGIDDEEGLAVAVDSDGAIIVAGRTGSDDFPVTEGAYQETEAENSIVDHDAFVTKIAADLQSLTFSTYLGTFGEDVANDIAVDGANNIIVVGTTNPLGDNNAQFPTTPNAIRPLNENLLDDAFLAKFDNSGTAEFVTLLGGPGVDEGKAVASNLNGELFVALDTADATDPPPSENAYQDVSGGASDAYLIKLTPDGQSVLYGTYFGGAAIEETVAIEVDAFGSVTLFGNTNGEGLPLMNPIQEQYGGDVRDAFLASFTSNGDGLLFSTYLGADGADFAFDGALDSEGAAYITGNTRSEEFPTENPVQSELLGEQDAFVTKIDETLADFRYEYVSKVVCGDQPSGDSRQLITGAYGTTVNVHYPGEGQASFRKKLALSVPPGNQQPGVIVPLAVDSLRYDEAMATDCDDILERVSANNPEESDAIDEHGYFEGFVVLQSTDSLDVDTVYTSGELPTNQGTPMNASIDVERIAERDRLQPADLFIRKQAFEIPPIRTSGFAFLPIPGGAEVFYVGYLISVENLGEAEAFNIVIKDIFSWDDAVAVITDPSLFLFENGTTMELDSITSFPALPGQLPSTGIIRITAEIPSIAPQQVSSVAFWTAGIRSTQQLETTLVDTAVVTSPNDDPNLANNSVEVVTNF